MWIAGNTWGDTMNTIYFKIDPVIITFKSLDLNNCI